MSLISTTLYVQISPEFYTDGTVRRIRPARMTSRRPHPGSQMPGTALVRLRLELDDSAFTELAAVAQIPAAALHIVRAEPELDDEEGSADAD